MHGLPSSSDYSHFIINALRLTKKPMSEFSWPFYTVRVSRLNASMPTGCRESHPLTRTGSFTQECGKNACGRLQRPNMILRFRGLKKKHWAVCTDWRAAALSLDRGSRSRTHKTARDRFNAQIRRGPSRKTSRSQAVTRLSINYLFYNTIERTCRRINGYTSRNTKENHNDWA